MPVIEHLTGAEVGRSDLSRAFSGCAFGAVAERATVAGDGPACLKSVSVSHVSRRRATAPGSVDLCPSGALVAGPPSGVPGETRWAAPLAKTSFSNEPNAFLPHSPDTLAEIPKI